MIKNKNISVLDKMVNTEEVIDSKSLSKEVSVQLLEGPKENYDILKQIGLDHHLEINKAKIAEKNSVRELSKIYGGKTYVGKDIKKLCNLYDLKLGLARDYKGLLSKELPDVIKSFIEKNSEEVVDKRDETKLVKKSKVDLVYANFFVLAPTEDFLKTSEKKTTCTLFYRESSDDGRWEANEKDKFIEIHSWGSNYSSLRAYNHMYNQYDYEALGNDETSVRTVVTSSTGILIMLFLLGIFSSYFYTTVILSAIVILFIFLNSINTNILHYKKWNRPNFGR